MDEEIQAQLAALGDEVEAALISEGCKHTAAWCIKQLPTLYVQFRQTNESRYGDEITRLVRAALKELATSKKACPESQKLVVSITDRLRLLHDEFGLPGLILKPVAAAPVRSRKVG